MSSHKKFDSKMTNKLLADYKTTIKKHTEENSSLVIKVADLKTTLDLNQTLLVNFITYSIGESPKVSELLYQTKEIWDENEKLIKDKNELELKTFKLQEIIEDTPIEIREEIALIESKNAQMKQSLVQKDALIKKLRSELQKGRNGALFKNPRNEILVTDPTRTNLEINHELLYTKSVLEKITSMQAVAKSKADKLDREVKTLQGELASMRRSSKENNDIPNNHNEYYNIHPQFQSFELGEEDRKCQGKGKGKDKCSDKVKEKENSENKQPMPVTPNIKSQPIISIAKLNLGNLPNKIIQEESQVSSSSKEEDLDDDRIDESIDRKFKYKAKTKQKELELLTEEYNNLRKQNDEYEKKIEKYKKVYKDMKEKIQNLTSMIKHSDNTDTKVIVDSSTDDTIFNKGKNR